MTDTEMSIHLLTLGIMVKSNDELVDRAYESGYTWNESKQLWIERH